MKKFKLLTLTLLVLAICMTSVSATAALNPVGTYEEGIVTVTASGEAGAADATIIATRQDGELDSAPATFSEADILASVVYIDQFDAAADMSVSFAPERVAEGDTVSVFMAGAGASGIEIENVSLEEEEPVDRTLVLTLNGGTLDPAAPGTYPEAGYVLPEPTKAGFTFGGWYANGEFTGDAVTEIAAAEAAIGGAKTFYAKWLENVASFVYDSGYCAPEEESVEDVTGVISVTVSFASHIDNVTNAGFYVYLTGGFNDKVDISGECAASDFYTVVYDIPEEEFDTTIIFMPYVVTDEGTVFGTARELTVNSASALGELQYLGTIEDLAAELALDAE
ncbi:MAG: InlB B-repeat-containing protein [Clostridia bacterium]|nr:InlB B-repeat-containing protein [Clostridia bacterium]